MRWTWWTALALLAVSCSAGSCATGGPASSARTNNPQPAGPASSKAADLRTHLDLLLAEHVMIIAKSSAAAADHTDEYASYTALLTTNQGDLDGAMSNAFGSTSADAFSRIWNQQNRYLVDYGIGVVTHNDDRSGAAMAKLTNDFVPKFASWITDVSGLPNDEETRQLSAQVSADKRFIDDAGAQRFPNFYADLQTAYALSVHLGDSLAQRIAQKFPDEFPGDPTVPQVDRRVSLNMLLQQHAWLATMATDAVVAGRDADRTAAAAALGGDASALSRLLGDLFGPSTSSSFDKAWAARDAALLTYAANGDAASKQALSATAPQVSSILHVQPTLVSDQLTALIEVIDDQRGKSFKAIAGDDRAAATSMRPIGDAIVGGG